MITILVISIGFAPYINVAEVLAAAPPRRPILASPAPNATTSATLGTFQMSATASSSYVQFVQTIYQNEAGTQIVQTNSQTSTQTGWSGQDASSSKAYVSGSVTGTAATFQLQTPLVASTTYYWGAQTVDPDGGGGSSTSSLTLVTPTWTNTTAMSGVSTDQSAVTYNGYIYKVGGAVDGGGTATSSVSYAQINSNGTVGAWAVTTALPDAIYGLSAAAYNGNIYSTGGGTSTVRYAPINSNGTIGAWTNTQALPTTLRFHSAIAYNGYLYALGDGATSTAFYAPINSNGTVGSWAATNAKPRAIDRYGAIAYNGYMYTTGGSTDSGINGTSTVYYAAINANGTVGSWSTTTVLPANRFQHASVMMNGYIYTVGGGHGSPVSTVYYAPVNSDGTVGTWSTTTNLPTAIGHHSALVSNGYLYVLGGRASGGDAATTTVLYAQINEKGRIGDEGWRTNTALPGAIYQASAVVYNGYLYAIGGRLNSSGSTSTVRYAPISASGMVGVWTSTTALPNVLSLHSAVAYNGHLYVTGGTDGGLCPCSPTSTVRYVAINSDGSLGSNWITATTIPAALMDHSAVAYNGYLYVPGGGNGTSNGASSTVRYVAINSDGSLGSNWTNTTALPYIVTAHSAVASQGYLYVEGGTADSSATSTVMYAPINSDGTVGTWTYTTKLPVATGPSTVVYNGYLYATGGSVTSTVYYAAVGPAATASGTISSWLAATAPGSSLRSAVVSNGYLYMIGGISNPTSSVFSAPLLTSLTAFMPTAGGAVATGTLAIKAHPCCQQINKFDIDRTNATGTQLFNFQVSSTIENINVSQIIFNLTNVTGFDFTNITSTELFVDYDGDGTLGGGETTTVMASGTTAITGSNGTITFAGALTVTSTLNLILKANVTSIDRGDWFRMSLSGSGITATGVTSGQSITTAGSTISMTHFKPYRMGASTPTEFGAPAAQAVGGGAPGGGDQATGGGAPPAGGSGIAVDVDTITSSTASFPSYTTDAFSTSQDNELLLAFLGADCAGQPCVFTSVTSTPALTWVLVARTNSLNGQNGTAEIWRAFATSTLSNAKVTATIGPGSDTPAYLNVVSFTGVNTSGANGAGAIGATSTASSANGNPTINVTTTVAGSWVWGNAWDFNATQNWTSSGTSTITHAFSNAVNRDSGFIERANSVTVTAGTVIQLNATPSDMYNFSAVEILPVAAGGNQGGGSPGAGSGGSP